MTEPAVGVPCAHMSGDFPCAISTNAQVEHLAHHSRPWWINLEPPWLIRSGRRLRPLVPESRQAFDKLARGAECFPPSFRAVLDASTLHPRYGGSERHLGFAFGRAAI